MDSLNKLNAQSVDLILTELLVLEDAVKPITKRITEIREWCKEQGSFSTDRFVVAIKQRTQLRLAGLEAAIDALGKETLEKNGLIQEVEVVLVNVAKKD